MKKALLLATPKTTASASANMATVSGSSGSEYEDMCEMIPAAQSHANTVNGSILPGESGAVAPVFTGHSVP